jgi:ABC-2 type transport system ATP-binding protein
MAVIETIGIEKRFGDLAALRGVSLRIEEGELFGLFGPNGAGKTTLLRILSGQLVQSNGLAKVLGIEVKDDPLEVKRRIGIVPEVESPPSYLTAYEYLYFVANVRKVENAEKEISNWLKFFELEGSENVLCKDLSKGMRQMMMLSGAFIHRPKLMFLDEPFINLDPIFQRKVTDFLLKYVKNGGTIFMCTHILEIAEKLCKTVAIINKGSVIARGTIGDLVKGHENLQEAFLDRVNNEGRGK